MINKEKIFAMIPARIGSNRLKMKNLALLDGKPMIQYAIESAIQSGIYDKIILNSDHETFRQIADQLGVTFYKRPTELGGSDVQSDDVVEDFLNNFDECDLIVWQNPIAPLLIVTDIQNSINYFNENNLDSMFTVTRAQTQCLYNGTPVNFETKDKFALTQDLNPVYALNHSIMMWRAKTFVKTKKEKGYAFFAGKVGYFEVSKSSSVIVKTKEDLQFVEALIRIKQSNSEIQYFEEK
jgi:CMP-N-acetylneuraminic acid synthetase